jgi:CHAT domain-containing protein/Tfp pilus assembly protein PilF
MRPSLLLVLLALLVAPPVVTPSVAQDLVIELSRNLTEGGRLEADGQLDSALAAYQKALELSQRRFGKDHLNTAAIQKSVGDLLRKMGRYRDAEPYFEEGLRICRQQGDKELGLEMMTSLASGYVEQGRFEESRQLSLECLSAVESIYGKTSPQTAIVLGNVAGVFSALGDLEQAEKAYARSVQLLEGRSGKEGALANNLMNLASIHSDRGDYTRALSLLDRAIAIAERQYGKTNYQVALIRNNVAVIHQGLGQFERAEELHRGILKTLEATIGPSHPDIARTLNNLAIVLEKQGQMDEAEALYRRGLAVRETQLGADHPATLIALDSLAKFLVNQGRLDEAEPLIQRSLSGRTEKLGARHPLRAYSLMALAGLRLRQERVGEAEQLFRDALALRQEVLSPSHPDLAYGHASLGFALAAQKRIEPAAEELHLARQAFRRYVSTILPGLSEKEQLSFLKTTDEQSLHAALGLAFESENPVIVQKSAEWVLNGKAVSQEALAQRSLLARDLIDRAITAVAEKLQRIRRQLAAIVHAQDAASGSLSPQELERQETELARELAARSGTTVEQADWMPADEVRRRLASSETLIEIARVSRLDYVRGEPSPGQERYAAWIIPPAGSGKIQFVDLGLAAEIEELVKQTRDTLSKSTTLIPERGDLEAEAELKPVLAALSSRVLLPLRPHLGDRSRIVLSPDAMLWLIPWAALPLEDGKYLVESHSLRFVVSGRHLSEPMAQITPDRPIVMADPDYDLDPAGVRKAADSLFGGRTTKPASKPAAVGASRLGRVERLPGTRLEAEAVKPLLETITGAEPYLYAASFAQESVFKRLRSPRILVLCTHGFFQDVPSKSLGANPLLRCGLLLTGCNKPERDSLDSEDGILTGLEIIGTDLRGTDLVVLSACETGVGEVRSGEGVAGLKQAFQLAGARSVVSSLWSVPDRETSRLMITFFRQIADGKEASDALRESQLSIISARRDRYGTAHPFFWAAFTVTGR